MKTITISNQKGGVAKTTTAINLATDLANNGNNVIVIDLDSQGNSTQALLDNFDIRLEKNIVNIIDHALKSNARLNISKSIILDNIVETKFDNLDLIPSITNVSTKEIQFITSQLLSKETFINEISNQLEYDYIIIDCPPNLNILTLSALISGDIVIVPTDLEMFGMEGTETTINYVKQLGLNYRVLITKYSDLVVEREFLKNTDYVQENKLDTIIRFQKKYITEQYDKKDNIAVLREHKDNNVGRDYKNFRKELLNELEKEVNENE